MKRKIAVIMVASTLLIVGCSTHIHTVGAGPQNGVKTNSRQYYLLWGLIPLNTVNTDEMAGKDIKGNTITNYEIQTQIGPMDALISVASMITIAGLVSSRTVTVTK
ncbi:MAG TPA: hypothetical protein QGH56_06810 [Candidatus Marinimicrobia bacterium]|nr:hypothetical protein [Candidatus Neomarinimicrobiota bacterium]